MAALHVILVGMFVALVLTLLWMALQQMGR